MASFELAALCLLVAFAIVGVHMDQRRIRRISSRRITYPLFAMAADDDDPTVTLPPPRHDPNSRMDRPRSGNATSSSPSSLIRIVQPSANRYTALPWRDLASMWNRNATIDDILARVSNESSLLPSVPPNDRVVIVLHSTPKMGSMTLRIACRNSLITNCGRLSRNRVEPDGFRDGSELAGIMRRCNSTHHFCLGREMFPMGSEISRFESTSFFHLYPFRNYDAWAISALKQVFDRGGVENCEKVDASLDDCRDMRPELSFSKYPKMRMSIALPQVMRRVDEMGETHHIVLYPYDEIDALLSVFGEIYHVPLLPGSAESYHSERPEGTCNDSILDKFHMCFTHKLDKLP
ncbi:hypothetical protein ACHAXA_009923 [Cyclostephanos tholiformis]|uniref:Uncharacterized protein n=1 Tax=Cyclostephanos tholiformis TaxID=382380 RepID=A0ABD3RXZ5_9STRA